MSLLRYTLLTDGGSDRLLIPVLNWCLRANGYQQAIEPMWADLSRLFRPPRTLAERIQTSLELYPCDLLFVHRDAERFSLTSRRSEVQEAISRSADVMATTRSVVVVPVRMSEAWLLTQETAIRIAAGNPSGTHPLNLPPIRQLEALPDPKNTLHDILREASGLYGRRLKRLNVHALSFRAAEVTQDFSALRQLPAFQMVDEQIQEFLSQYRQLPTQF